MVIGHQQLPADERRLIMEVFAAGERQLREVMLPRTEVEFMAADTTLAEAAVLAATMPHSRFPVYRDSYDDIIGFVHVRDLLDPVLTGRVEPISEIVRIRPVKFVPASKRVLPTLSEMRDEGQHLAIVVDEYGGTAGIVTLEDLVEELIGDIRDEYDLVAEQAVRLAAGKIEIDGLTNLDDVAAETGIRLPEGPYETLGGFVMAALGRLPALGDRVEIPGFVLTVIEMDGRRIARVRFERRIAASLDRQAAQGTEAGTTKTPQEETGDTCAGDTPKTGAHRAGTPARRHGSGEDAGKP